ncbi:mobile element transfer protein [Streptomyces alboflavus]|uniref:Mobile element transfer protein n=1 Tax=Streptomyces alboflavus TaxID=67267 RepID=A0A1Z1W5W8_9ACTN|nr:DUF2637 domain-containing protein [Streptomyces alboflavus]ARX81806.1 mobile element transfer protein [Streptomyces alboflavus]
MTRSIRADAVLIQAVIAGALSFAHLHDLAAAAGQAGWKAWAYPVSVDLLLVASWRRLRYGGPARLAWSWFLIALIASLGANVATAGFLDLQHPPAWLRFSVAGWPALAFLGGTLLAHQPEPGPEPASAPAPTPAPERPEPSISAVPEQAPEPVEITPPEPASVPALPEAAPPVPPALLDHARKVAIDYRARTGAEIDTATLRARLGVPAPLAHAIAAQLA